MLLVGVWWVLTDLLGIVGGVIPEDVRMSPHQLVGDAVGDLGESESALLLPDPRPEGVPGISSRPRDR